jgi:hypothetical protein
VSGKRRDVVTSTHRGGDLIQSSAAVRRGTAALDAVVTQFDPQIGSDPRPRDSGQRGRLPSRERSNGCHVTRAG